MNASIHGLALYKPALWKLIAVCFLKVLEQIGNGLGTFRNRLAMAINCSSETFAKNILWTFSTFHLTRTNDHCCVKNCVIFSMFFSKTCSFKRLSTFTTSYHTPPKKKRPHHPHRPNQQPSTKNDQEHVFCWLNLLAPTLTNLNHTQA